VAGGVELLFPAKYLGDKRTLFGQQLLLTLRQSSHQHNVTMVAVRIGTTVSGPYDDGLQLEIPPIAIGNSWETIQVGKHMRYSDVSIVTVDQVTTQFMVRGGGQATEQQLRRVLTNISTIALSTVVSNISRDNIVQAATYIVRKSPLKKMNLKMCQGKNPGLKRNF